jgi:2',3'-cyclic-nucleotide 2'-phosphodiesterase
MHDNIRVLMLGDVVGAPGRAIFQKYSAQLREKYKAQALIVNGENSSSDGKGITPRIMRFFKHNGADIVTSGNHIWAKRDIYSYLQEHRDLLRPANFPSTCPGVGVTTFTAGAFTVGVLNIQARTFMREQVACPFRTAESLLTYVKTKTNIILVDFHGEATSEKMALAYYLDSQISALVGTHTHVQTADARILPGGTAYITDLGMAGALNSLIGMKKEPIIHQMLTQMPVKFEVETKPPYVLSGVCIEITPATGKATTIEPIYIVDDTLQLHEELDGQL